MYDAGTPTISPRRLRRRGVLTAIALVVGAIGAAAAGSAPAAAGNNSGSVQIDVFVEGAGAVDVLDGLTVELVRPDNSVLMPTCTTDFGPAGLGGSTLNAVWQVSCDDVPYGTYTVGFDGAPDGLYVDNASCFSHGGVVLLEVLPGQTAQFSLNSASLAVDCQLGMVLPSVFIDKVLGEIPPPGPDPFELEVFSGGELTASGQDPDEGVCVNEFLVIDPSIEDQCLAIPLGMGDYQLGEVPQPGYLPTAVWCVDTAFAIDAPAEVFPSGVGEFSLGVDFEPDAPFVYCRITNDLFVGRVVVDKVVVNDDGGTATADDFTAEVFTDPGGVLAVSNQCAADGSCIDDSLPIGDYRIGESGPDGYTANVSCVVTEQPIDPPINTDPPEIQVREAIPGADAAFEIGPLGEVTCTITNDDDPQPTTTTTTTTTTPPTTAAPTTQPPPPTPPTTPTANLPATGSSSTSLPIVAIALGLIATGGSLIAVRRRA